jgi:hypothetical protein
MEKEFKQKYEDIINGKSLRHYWKPTYKMLTEALAEADKKNKELSKLLHLCEGTCETHEEIGQEQHEKIKELLFALRDLADYYLFEKELDTDELVDMTNKVEIILEKNKHFE